MEKELRTVDTKFEIREEAGKSIIEGIASTFGDWYDCGWYQERIEQGAFDEAVKGNKVKCLFNHDPNLVLGSKKSGTLMINVDDSGLRYVNYPPDTTYAKDLLVSMQRGDVDESSFAFTVAEDKWDIDSDGTYRRTVKKIDVLYDVSPVTYPANPNTNVYARSKEDVDKMFEEKQSEIDEEANAIKLRKAQAEQEMLEDELRLLS